MFIKCNKLSGVITTDWRRKLWCALKYIYDNIWEAQKIYMAVCEKYKIHMTISEKYTLQDMRIAFQKLFCRIMALHWFGNFSGGNSGEHVGRSWGANGSLRVLFRGCYFPATSILTGILGLSLVWIFSSEVSVVCPHKYTWLSIHIFLTRVFLQVFDYQDWEVKERLSLFSGDC